MVEISFSQRLVPRHNHVPEPGTTNSSYSVCSLVGWVWAYPGSVSPHRALSLTCAEVLLPPCVKSILRSRCAVLCCLPGCFQLSYLLKLHFSVLVGDCSSPLGTQKEDLFLDSVFRYSFQQDELSQITAWAGEGEQHVKYSSFWGQLRSRCLRSWEPWAPRLQPRAPAGGCCILSLPGCCGWAGSASAVKTEVT